MMTRRSFASKLAVGAAPALILGQGRAGVPMARNIVMVHDGLLADGSCWSEVIPRLQSVGLNVTLVQNPLTTLNDAVAETQRVLARQDGIEVAKGNPL